MFHPGDIISHAEMSHFEGFSLQQGMNFRSGRNKTSILLMSTTHNAPYADRTLNAGKTIIYEGHDIRSDLVDDSPKNHDQPLTLPSGNLTANGKFYQSAKSVSKEVVRVYEKLKPGIWVYNGQFTLKNAYIENDGRRNTVKFELSIIEEQGAPETSSNSHDMEDLAQTRMIPSWVKFEVFKRDSGACVKCGSKDNLHYDHVLPYSRGGTSLKTENIQLLCARHNLQKSNRIE